MSPGRVAGVRGLISSYPTMGSAWRLAAPGDLRAFQLPAQAACESEHLRRASAHRNDHEGGLGRAADGVLGAQVRRHHVRDPRQQLLGGFLADLVRKIAVAVDAECHHRELPAVTACVRKMLAPFGDQVMRSESAGDRIVRDGLRQRLLARLELPTGPD